MTAKIDGVKYNVYTAKTKEKGLKLLSTYPRFHHIMYDKMMKLYFYYFTA